MYGGSVPYTANSVVLNGSYQGQMPAPGVGPPFVSSAFPVFNPIPTNLPYVFPTGQFSAPPFFGHPGYDPVEQTQQNVPYSSVPLPSAASSMLPSASPSVPLPVPIPVPPQPAASPPHASMFCPSCRTLSYRDPSVPRPLVCPTCGRRPFAEETAEKPHDAAMESEAKRVKTAEQGAKPLKPNVNQLNSMNSMNSVSGMNSMSGMNGMNGMSGIDSMNAVKRMSGVSGLNSMNAMTGVSGLNSMTGVNLLSGERLDPFERRDLYDPSGRLDPPLSVPSVFPRSAFSHPSHVPHVPIVPHAPHVPIVPIIPNHPTHPTHPNHPSLLNSSISSASILHDVKLVLNSLLARVEKIVLKEERQIQEDVQTIVSNLLTRVEQYTAGHLHCCCFQPSFVQRHFIQCNKCDVWYHTSCVGVDSRKLGLIEDFLCPWCDTDHAMKLQFDKLAEEQPAICPLCKRQFPRPCNLSRHLHSRHGMKWSLHMQLHVDLDEYLDQELPLCANASSPAQLLCEGCFFRENEDVLKRFPMDKKRLRFLLRKLRAKPIQWWVNRSILVRKDGAFVKGTICGLRPRGEVNVRIDESVSLFGPLFDGNRNARIPILGFTYELELWRAVPYDQPRDSKRDIKLFLRRSCFVC